MLSECSPVAIAWQVKDAEEDVADAKSDEARDKAQMALEQLKAIAAAV